MTADLFSITSHGGIPAGQSKSAGDDFGLFCGTKITVFLALDIQGDFKSTYSKTTPLWQECGKRGQCHMCAELECCAGQH